MFRPKPAPKQCISCKEEIPETATRCEHCQESVDTEVRSGLDKLSVLPTNFVDKIKDKFKKHGVEV